MPYLIISDIHGNREALEAVLAAAEGRYDQILCLGDLVGYGADPNFAVEWARASVAAVVRGNHDRACVESASLEGYRPAARLAAEWTRTVLSADNLAYIERLPRGPLPIFSPAGSFDLVHGSPIDEDEYLITAGDVAPLIPYLETPLTFFGHTHQQGGFLIARGGVKNLDPARILDIERDYMYLVNPGSAGQPRDGDPDAAFALYSPEERVVEFCRASYDVHAAAEKILAAGLPDSLAARLTRGR